MSLRCLLLMILSIAALAACTSHNGEQDALRNRVDTVEKRLTATYRPGLGEFMLGIQMHHAKLWMAGENANWKLADFELSEIKETIDDIKQYNYDRPEVNMIPMIEPVIDTVDTAIKQKNPEKFRSSFLLLTNTCNSCHAATHHEFNVIKVPDAAPVPNQDFKPQ